jgi:hypothetical protein
VKGVSQSGSANSPATGRRLHDTEHLVGDAVTINTTGPVLARDRRLSADEGRQEETGARGGRLGSGCRGGQGAAIAIERIGA